MAEGQVGEAGRLIERAHEARALSSAVDALAAGTSGAMLVRGAPGTGRTALLAEAVAHAVDRDLAIAVVQAVAVEREVRLGLVHDLVSAAAARLPEAWTPGDWHVREPELDRIVLLADALCAVARRRPLLLVVDDVQWADQASDLVLRALLRRLDRAPVLLLVSAVDAWPGRAEADDDTPPLTGDHVVTLGPLTAQDTRRVCAELAGTAPEAEFAAAAWAATGGNPGLLVPALREFLHEGRHPRAASVQRFRELVAARRALRLDALIAALPGECTEVLRVLAVTGCATGLMVLDYVLAGSGNLDDVLETLRANGLVTGTDLLELTDDTVRQRVLAGMAVTERRELSGRVAALLHRIAVPDEVLARVLLDVPPAEPWAIEVLHRAAGEARTAGRDRDAVALIEHALSADPAAIDNRLELASALVVDNPAASDRVLGVLLAMADDEPGPGPHHLMAADLLLSRGNASAAQRAIGARIARRPDAWTGERTPDPRLDALISLYGATSTIVHSRRWGSQPTPARGRAVPDDPVAAGFAAHRAAAAAADREQTCSLARTALAAGYDEQPLAQPRIAACIALLLADELDDAEAGLTAVLSESRRRRHRVPAAAALINLGLAACHRGRLDEAAELIDDAYAELPLSSWHPLVQPFPVACKVLVAAARGGIDDAERTLTRHLDHGADRGFAWSYLLFSRGSLAMAKGDPAAALPHLTECGRRLTGRRWYNPTLLPWRLLAAQAWHDTGDAAQAHALLAEDRQIAQAWGTPSAVGATELAAGTVFVDADSARHLAKAERVLRTGPARLLHTRAVAAQALSGLAHGKQGARAALETAIHRAVELGADAVARGWEARPPGEVPQSRVVASIAGLSPAESTVATLAGDGLTNPEIADELSVTRRTVELHLTHVYRKLGVHRRAELVALLAARGEGERGGR